MKIVCDTNILVSARLYGGKPRIIYELIAFHRKLEGITTPFLLKEYLRVLQDKFFYNHVELQEVKEEIKTYFTLVTPIDIRSIISDEPDNELLAITHEVTVDAIVSGDKAVLAVRDYHDVPIMTADDFLAQHHFETTDEDRFYDNLLG